MAGCTHGSPPLPYATETAPQLPLETIGAAIRILDHVGMVPGQVRHALFDFDGTLSLLRAGWQHVMEQYFCEVLCAAAPATIHSPAPQIRTSAIPARISCRISVLPWAIWLI